jgi:hypothetical protein
LKEVRIINSNKTAIPEVIPREGVERVPQPPERIKPELPE